MKNIEVSKSFLIKLIQSAKQLDNKLVFDLLDNLDKLPQPLNSSDLDKLIEELSLKIDNLSDKNKKEIFYRRYQTLPLSIKREDTSKSDNPYRSSKGLFKLINDFISNPDMPPTSALYLYMALNDLSDDEIKGLIEYSNSQSKPLTILNLESIMKDIYSLHKRTIDSGQLFGEDESLDFADTLNSQAPTK